MTIGASIHRFASVPSTNDTARELARRGADHGAVVTADGQTQGRGTKGRSWHSPAGLGLYASFILRPVDSVETRRSLPLLPLAAGLAVADAVWAVAGIEARIRWPNDVILGRKKLAGVLAEAVFEGETPRFAVLGIGINVNHVETDFPADLRAQATSLRILSGRPADKEALLSNLCLTLDSWYNSLLGGAREAVIEACERRLAFSPGGLIHVSTGASDFRGVFRGLGPDGRLRLEVSGRAVSLTFEEVRALDWD